MVWFFSLVNGQLRNVFAPSETVVWIGNAEADVASASGVTLDVSVAVPAMVVFCGLVSDFDFEILVPKTAARIPPVKIAIPIAAQATSIMNLFLLSPNIVGDSTDFSSREIDSRYGVSVWTTRYFGEVSRYTSGAGSGTACRPF